MSQSDLSNTPTPIFSLSADASEKRRRGRPRKYPRLNFEDDVRLGKNLNINRQEITCTPPRLEWVNGDEDHQVNPGEGAVDVMLGQVVSGVVEAVFDAGYLLCVRVGDSGTTFRGVVFKPGHYIPVSADNDVAPNLQMIRRNEIPLQTEGREFTSRSGNGTFAFNEPVETNHASRHGSRSSNHVSETEKQISPVATQSAHMISPRDELVPELVPELLPPSDLVNGVLEPSESTFVVASKGKQVLENESTPVNTTVGKEALIAQSHIPEQANKKGIPSENDPSSQLSSESLDDVEAKSTKFSGLPFENLVTEVVKRIHPSPLEKSQIEFNKLADNNPGEANNDAEQSLMIEPLTVIQIDPPRSTESFSNPMDNNRASRMTELLQVLQENMTQSEEQQADMITTDMGLEVDEQEPKWGETESKLYSDDEKDRFEGLDFNI